MSRLKLMRWGTVETTVPRYMRPGDAGLDLCAAVRPGILTRTPDGRQLVDHYLKYTGLGPVLQLPHGASALVPTGWAVQIAEGFEGQVRGRSGKSEARVLVVLGTIDSNYRGELSFQLENRSGSTLSVLTGDRLAQLVIVPVDSATVEIVSALDPSVRGDKGFGSSGERGT